MPLELNVLAYDKIEQRSIYVPSNAFRILEKLIGRKPVEKGQDTKGIRWMPRR